MHSCAIITFMSHLGVNNELSYEHAYWPNTWEKKISWEKKRQRQITVTANSLLKNGIHYITVRFYSHSPSFFSKWHLPVHTETAKAEFPKTQRVHCSLLRAHTHTYTSTRQRMHPQSTAKCRKHTHAYANRHTWHTLLHLVGLLKYSRSSSTRKCSVLFLHKDAHAPSPPLQPAIILNMNISKHIVL